LEVRPFLIFGLLTVTRWRQIDVKPSTQVQYNYNTTAIQELFLVLQLYCICADRLIDVQGVWDCGLKLHCTSEPIRSVAADLREGRISVLSGVKTPHMMTTRCCTTNLTGYGHVVQHLQLVVSLSVGGVVQHVRIAGVRVVEFGTYIRCIQNK